MLENQVEAFQVQAALADRDEPIGAARGRVPGQQRAIPGACSDGKATAAYGDRLREDRAVVVDLNRRVVIGRRGGAGRFQRVEMAALRRDRQAADDVNHGWGPVGCWSGLLACFGSRAWTRLRRGTASFTTD